MKSIKNKLILIISILVSITVSAVAILGYTFSSKAIRNSVSRNIEDKLNADIFSMFRYIQQEHGTISVNDDGTLIDSHGKNLEKSNKVVDMVYQDLDAAATIYKKEGNDFKIVTTNVRDKNSERVIGEVLHRKSSAYKNLSKGKAYVGITNINGEDYKTSYLLIYSDNGKVVGAASIGVPISDIKLEIRNSLNSLAIIFIVIIVVSLIVNIVLVRLIGIAITKGLVKVSEFSDNLRQLDIKDNIPDNVLALRDEVGDVANSMQVAINALRDFVSDTDSISDNVKEYTEEVLKNMNQVRTSASEISLAANQIAEGATSQAKETESGNIEAEELGESIDSNKKDLALLVNLMKEVETLRAEGINIVKELANESVKAIEATNEIYNVIEETNIKAKDIEKASEIIKDISEQINLVALNASIEAARAGESGKGFSVVAEEVRKLAEESNKSNDEIENVVKELTVKTESAVETVNKMVDMMKKQHNSVNVTVNKFEGISNSLEKTNNALDNLNKSSSDIEEKKDIMINLMQNLSAIAEENAASTQEVSASVEEQTSIISSLSHSINEMAEMSDKMKENISKFQY